MILRPSRAQVDPDTHEWHDECFDDSPYCDITRPHGSRCSGAVCQTGDNEGRRCQCGMETCDEYYPVCERPGGTDDTAHCTMPLCAEGENSLAHYDDYRDWSATRYCKCVSASDDAIFEECNFHQPRCSTASGQCSFPTCDVTDGSGPHSGFAGDDYEACQCANTACHKPEVCRIDAGLPGGSTCKQPKVKRCPNSPAVATSYCQCGGGMHCDPGELCDRSGGKFQTQCLLATPCDIQDGTGPSSHYPCQCGNARCSDRGGEEWCSAEQDYCEWYGWHARPAADPEDPPSGGEPGCADVYAEVEGALAAHSPAAAVCAGGRTSCGGVLEMMVPDQTDLATGCAWSGVEVCSQHWEATAYLRRSIAVSLCSAMLVQDPAYVVGALEAEPSQFKDENNAPPSSSTLFVSSSNDPRCAGGSGSGSRDFQPANSTWAAGELMVRQVPAGGRARAAAAGDDGGGQGERWGKMHARTHVRTCARTHSPLALPTHRALSCHKRSACYLPKSRG